MSDVTGEQQPAARRRAIRRLACDAALVEIAPALKRRGVRPLVLKGAAFAHWLYDRPEERDYADIDLLIDPDRSDAAGETLAQLGFTAVLDRTHPHEHGPHHSIWDRDWDPPARVELHHTLFSLRAPPSLVWQRLSADSGAFDLNGTCLPMPSPAASGLIVALHAAQHGVAEAKPMGDLALAVGRLELDTWHKAAALASELGGGEAFATGLRLDPGGRYLADALRLPKAAPRGVRLHASTPPDTTIGFERLATTAGFGARLRLVARELVPSHEFMRAAYPGARNGRWGLLKQYFARPFRLAGKLPRGLLAWLRIASRPKE